MAGSHFSPGGPFLMVPLRERSCPADIGCSATPRRHRNSTTSTPISFRLPSEPPFLLPAAKSCRHEKKYPPGPNFTVPTALAMPICLFRRLVGGGVALRRPETARCAGSKTYLAESSPGRREMLQFCRP